MMMIVSRGRSVERTRVSCERVSGDLPVVVSNAEVVVSRRVVSLGRRKGSGVH